MQQSYGSDDPRTSLLATREGSSEISYSSVEDVLMIEDDEPRGLFARLVSRLNEWMRLPPCGISPLVFSSVGLVLSTSMERVTFKLMIDRMLPYKFVLAEIICALICGLFTMATLLQLYSNNQITPEMKQFPQLQIFNMAVLDCLQFLLLIYSGAGVSPTMTVILLHTSTIFVVLGSKFVFPNRKYGLSHNIGLATMVAAIVLSLSAILWRDSSDGNDFYTTWYSCVYIVAASLQGLSTLYKERALAAWSRPINLYLLSAYLFFYQFFVTIAFSIVFYIIAGEEASMLHTIYYGWGCFLGDTPTTANRDDDLTAFVGCSLSLWVILGYVLSTFSVLVCLHTVLETSSHLVPRLLSIAIGASFVVLWIYDTLHTTRLPSQARLLGGAVGLPDLVAVILITIGTEIYGRDPEPDVELITHYPTAGADRLLPPAPPTTAAVEFVALTRDGKSNKMVMRN